MTPELFAIWTALLVMCGLLYAFIKVVDRKFDAINKNIEDVNRLIAAANSKLREGDEWKDGAL
jgi:4-hydroxybenzoate polyprenyltransferase